ncbi:ATP-binding protein [Roseimarinus sediminis]|uniref:ATP-binding protein n=1 Tax=Roseimarinus sediminis TaxID=1610899 RepID=UPI003D1B48C9
MIQRIKRKIILPALNRYIKIRSSVYGRVVFIIAAMSVIMFLSFGAIFRSVYGEYLRTVIRQNGNNVGSIVEGALYHSMLENDKSELQNTLDIINTMSGIDEVNLYDHNNQLVYTSFSPENAGHSDPDCISCHANLAEMFPGVEKSYRIIDMKSGCDMNLSDTDHRQLLIHSPVFNQPSCYTSSCHYHSADEKVLGALIIKAPLDDLDNAVSRSSSEFFILAILITGLLTGLLIYFTRRNIQQPLSKLIDASVAVANGDHTQRMKIKNNELSDIQMVSSAFNNMLDKLQAANIELENWSQQLEYKVQKKSEELSAAQNELIHIERIASLGKLSASVAHELNNPLSGILVYAKLISKQFVNSEVPHPKRESILRNLKFIENETKRCGDIVKGLLDFSRKEQDSFEEDHIHIILKETYKIVAHSVKIANIAFVSDFKAGNDLISCNQGQIKQAFVALLVNAIEAIGNNGEMMLSTSNPDSNSLLVSLSDTGSGIDENDLPHIFEPFFSTKHQTSGIGLGLAIVHGIIQNHNGKIEVNSKVGQGTTMSISLPLAGLKTT